MADDERKKKRETWLRTRGWQVDEFGATDHENPKLKFIPIDAAFQIECERRPPLPDDDLE